MSSTFRTVAELWHPAMFWIPETTVFSAWPEHIPFAFWLTAVHRPNKFVELGTHAGGSYFAFCQAIDRLGLSTAAYAIDTWNGDAHAGFYDETIFQSVNEISSRKYASFSTLVRSTFDDAIQYFEDGGIDLLHIDGLHTYDAVQHDFETWLPLLSDRAIVLFHDINVRRDHFGVFRFFEEMAEKHRTFKFNHGHGLGVLAVGDKHNENIEAFFELGKNDDAARDIRLTFARLGSTCSQGLHIKQLEEFQSHTRAEIVSKDAVRGALDAHAADLEAEVLSLKDKLRSLEIYKVQLVSLFNERNYEISSLRSHVNQKEILIKQQLIEFDAANNSIAELENELKAKIEILSDTELKLEMRENDLVRLRETSGKLSKELEVLSQQSISDFKVKLISRVISRVRYGKQSSIFDRNWYLSHNQDVRARKMDPWAHFMKYGLKEGRRPHPLFSDEWYNEAYPDVANSGLLPFEHFHRFGEREGRAPYFDGEWYALAYPDVADSGLEPADHFQYYGREEGRKPFERFGAL
ncbi:class I SAM-dependent methyltransferase [Pararhizobium sp. DWP1-1-3]|uniref:class I SAM-dependent methyltransferase n=1 Tax=Pararhizobium sp. DWP1-1-3 TaxID=2804652 RepID=UPI003CED886D